MNKKGIELSINFIVMLIIAIAVFGMGLMLFRQFFIQAEDIKQNLDEQTKAELTQKMMSSSEQVIVYPTQLTIKKNSGDVVGVGILNIGTNTDFDIYSSYIGCYDREGQLNPSCQDTDLGLIALRPDLNVDQNKREIFDVPVRVKSSALTAKYAIKVEVKDELNALIGTSIVYITVP